MPLDGDTVTYATKDIKCIKIETGVDIECIPLYVSVSSKLNNQEIKISPLLYNNHAQII